MGLFSKKKIDDITDIDELFAVLTKRKHWDRIDPGIIRFIFDNADGDILKVQRFIYISELHHCVDNNFVAIAKDHTDPRMVLAFFSITLERLAAQVAQQVPNLPDGSRKQNLAIGTAEMAYMSSILCNPLMLPSYGGLAWFYLYLDSSDRAVEVCREFEEAERRLLQTDDADLCYYDKEMKLRTTEMRSMITQIKAEIGIE